MCYLSTVRNTAAVEIFHWADLPSISVSEGNVFVKQSEVEFAEFLSFELILGELAWMICFMCNKMGLFILSFSVSIVLVEVCLFIKLRLKFYFSTVT